jgi:hypothetical protein
LSYLSRLEKDMRAGINQDDPGLGGRRIAGETGGNQEYESSDQLCVSNWFVSILPKYYDSDPTSKQVQVDTMSDGALYALFELDMRDLVGLGENEIPTRAVWKSVWTKRHSNVVYREVKSVDSKDRTRENLRALLRDKGSDALATRMHIRECMHAHREQMREYRLVYHKERTNAALSPETYISMITDGASSERYKGVGNCDSYDSGHEGISLKIVGTRIHGGGSNGLTIISIIHNDLVSDDSNLVCQLLHNAIGHISEMKAEQQEARFKSSQCAAGPRPSPPPPPPPIPPRVRLQVDGVSTNWGLITFAFVAFMVMTGICLGFEMARNPVGNTHEDIDALFGQIRRYLEGKSWCTVEEFIALVREALGTYGGKIVIEVIKDTLDFRGWLDGSVNKQLSNFSRHGGGVRKFHPGMHNYRCSIGAAPGKILSEFRQYSLDRFTAVTFDPEELAFWLPPDSNGALSSRFPALVYITSTWEERTVLKSRPESDFPTALAKRKDGWEEALSRALRETLQDLPRGASSGPLNSAWWETYVGAAGDRTSGPSGLFLPCTLADLRGAPIPKQGPRLAIRPVDSFHPAAREGAFIAAAGPVMRSGAAEPAPLCRVTQVPELTELRASSFAFAVIDSKPADGHERPFPLRYCLVQLPSVLPPGFSHTDPKVALVVSWWRPKEAKPRGYGGMWIPWMTQTGRKQWRDSIKRGAIFISDVELWEKSVTTGPLGKRWAKVKLDSTRLLT